MAAAAAPSKMKQPKLNVYDGHPLSLLVPESVYRYATSYVPYLDDVFIVSYPKCGNTWLMNVVYLLTHDGHPVPPDRKLYQEVPFLEFEGKDLVEQLEPPRVLKTHLPRDRIVFSPDAKYLYVVRNPKDCCVSLYHHTRFYVEDYDFADGTFEEFFESFLDGLCDSGDYFHHLMSWWPHRNDPNFLFMTYEGMKANPRQGIQRVAEFLGGSAADLVKDPVKMERVLDLSSFETMKKNAALYQYDCDGPGQFFRKAAVGDWKNFFTPEQEKKLNDRFEERFSGTDIKGLWKGLIDY